MRFERIFEDLEARFAHHEREEMRAVSEDLARAERAQLSLADRLRGAGGSPLALHLGTALRLEGTVEDVGEGWVSLHEEGGRRRTVVPLPAIALLEGLPVRARPAEETRRSTLGLGSVLRSIARDRSVVRLETTAGGIMGRLAAVGADAVDVHSLPTGESGAAPGSTRITVAMGALLAVRPR
ncbi:hypothetical protein BH708_06490 [Brachybacterium sp. P6-10-X1]|uniref:hypothetical protein n=1 Tax=Brachybacterium sp. P6-10-X1 TaxID=1903186 RepID=UPI000971A6EB|nr:hypothetical protein [Brachybacterium sp. P6-10-X1]APX34687.1 hypothetical protein BH708_06490 [Brachybacterium sp. P6-10-X1]